MENRHCLKLDLKLLAIILNPYSENVFFPRTDADISENGKREKSLGLLDKQWEQALNRSFHSDVPCVIHIEKKG